MTVPVSEDQEMAGRSERTENVVQVVVLLATGGMAAAASFTHMHDWTMANAPAGTGDWFGWTNAVVSDLIPMAAALEVRRRRRAGQPTGYPLAVLVGFALLSLAAQVACAKSSAGRASRSTRSELCRPVQRIRQRAERLVRRAEFFRRRLREVARGPGLPAGW